MNVLDRIWLVLQSKLNPLGNYDDPEPPDWFMPNRNKWVRRLRWWIRNPLHNFCWHWIGFKDRNLDYTQIWNTKQKWNLVLPFFSYRGSRIEFYIGWRPDSKMFGIALRRRKNANNT